MKANTNFLKNVGFGLVALSILVPNLSVASAITNTRPERATTKTEDQQKEAKEKAKAEQTAQYCKRLEQTTSKMVSEAETLRTRWNTTKTEKKSEISENREDRMGKLGEVRETGDSRRENHYTKLEERATTDAQKSAVAKFKATMETAVRTRRTAIDTALRTYKAGVDALLKKRQDDTQSALTKMRTSIKTATDKAKTDCTAGVDAATIRSTLQASTKAAREQFKTDRQNIEKGRTGLEELRKTRNASIKAAVDSFKTTAENARKELRSAFPSTSTTSSTQE